MWKHVSLQAGSPSCAGVNFLHCHWCGAVFWVCDQTALIRCGCFGSSWAVFAVPRPCVLQAAWPARSWLLKELPGARPAQPTLSTGIPRAVWCVLCNESFRTESRGESLGLWLRACFPGKWLKSTCCWEVLNKFLLLLCFTYRTAFITTRTFSVLLFCFSPSRGVGE